MIVGAHGIRGGVRIKSFTACPADVAAYGPVEDETGGRRFTLAVTGDAGQGMVIARASGVDDRSKAEVLKGTRLYVPRASLPPAADDEFYYADLIGLAAFNPDGSPLGVVTGVGNHGAGDILDIRLADGGRDISVPFTRSVVTEVNVADGRIVVDPPVALMVTAGSPGREEDA
jgi:16S rRNA processing protein RimM